MAAEQIVALAATLSAHDRKTRGHAERVRAYTDLIAEELRLPEHDRDRLRWSALLHDVGKLTVHADILNKPGSLSDDEWQLMRQHPREGAKLTAPLAAWLGPWANTIAGHHERFDGRGYPYELAGHEISTGGRIVAVAVADCYDTMTSLRSYNKPMSAQAARAELAACAGAQFDPVMVRAFLAVSVSRLHAVAPLSWSARSPSATSDPSWRGSPPPEDGWRWPGPRPPSASWGSPRANGPPPRPARRAAAAAIGVPGHSPGGWASPTGTGPGGGSHGGGGATSRPGWADRSGSTVRPGSTGHGSGTHTTLANGAPADQGSGDNGDQSSGDHGDPTTTAVPSGSDPTTPTTTVGGTTPVKSTTTTTTTTSSTTTTSTTTTTTLPPIVAPSGLQATGGCQVPVLGPEVKLSWTASPTTRVTGYVILRSTKKTSGYSSVGTTSGRTTVTYTDTSVGGLNSTYWYEVEAVAGGSGATSSPVSATTPTLCLESPGSLKKALGRLR